MGRTSGSPFDFGIDDIDAAAAKNSADDASRQIFSCVEKG